MELTERIKTIGTTVLEGLKSVYEAVTQSRRSLDGGILNDQEATLYTRQMETDIAARGAYQHLSREPLIAYVKALCDNEEHIYLFCRFYAPQVMSRAPKVFFGNRNSPLGQLASQKSGNTIGIRLPGGSATFHVIETDVFIPRFVDTGWDATKNDLSIPEGLRTVESFLKFIEKYGSAAETFRPTIPDLAQREEAVLRQLLDQMTLREGRRREIIARVELRDQPILDQEQDDIARMPLTSQFILSGAPGTGKTTTMIKRIAIKGDLVNNLQELSQYPDEERRILFSPGKAWIMFTPNDLLKKYLKEAFAKENIPASEEEHLKTWSTFSNSMVRDTIRLIGSKESGAPFSRVAEPILNVESNRDIIKVVKRFNKFAIKTICTELNSAMQEIVEHKMIPDISNFVLKAKKMPVNPSLTGLISILGEYGELSEILHPIRSEANGRIASHAQRLVGSDSTIPAKVQSLQGELKRKGQVAPIEENEDAEDNERDVDEIAVADPSVQAFQRVRAAVRWHSIRLAQGKKEPTESINSKIISLFNPEIMPKDSELIDLGRRYLTLRKASRIARGIAHLLDDMPSYYKRFRREMIRESNKYYSTPDVSVLDERRLDSIEIDVLTYLILRNLHFARTPSIFKLKSVQENRLIRAVSSLNWTQVLVDEATDFSSVQLGSMYYLANPKTTSVVFSGDLMQRVTQYGISDWNELRFISSSISHREVRVAYRQSAKLLPIAQKLYQEIIGDESDFVPYYSQSSSDPNPLKYCSHDSEESIGKWIAGRINEIYRINKEKLPSIAIFVPKKEDIETVFQVLKPALDEYAIQTEMCREGNVGDGEKVRIFDIEFIKGMEFEGVFFVNIDELESVNPDLIDKYIYVGLTRAALFLAVTYKKCFPKKIGFIQNDFSEGNWSELVG